MEVKNFQNEIIKFMSGWDKRRKVKPNENETFIHLVEEIGEIARQYVNKKTRKDKFNGEELDNAIGDALMQLVKLANLRNLDIEELIFNIIKEEQSLLNE